jgi:CcmD family protein
MPDVINNAALSMYVAAAVALVVMIGFFVYLWSLDRRVRELDREVRQQETRDIRPADAVREPLRPKPIEKERSDGLDRR